MTITLEAWTLIPLALFVLGCVLFVWGLIVDDGGLLAGSGQMLGSVVCWLLAAAVVIGYALA